MINPLNLSATWRDYWGMYNPPAVAQVAPLDNLACFRPRWLLLPDAKSEIVPASGKIDYNFFIKPGSILWGLRTSAIVDPTPPVGLLPNPPVAIPGGANPAVFDTLAVGEGNANTYGPFAFGGRLYVFLTGGINPTTAYMSADGGKTWAPQDFANSPVSGTLSVSGFLGSVLNIAIVTGGDIIVSQFDCSTNTWAPASVGAGLAGVNGTSVVIQPDGRRFVYYTTSGGANHIELDVLSAVGVWSGSTNLVTAPGGRHATLLGAILDTAGVSHLFYTQQDNAGSLNTVVGYMQISNAPAIVLSQPSILVLPPLVEQSNQTSIAFSPTMNGGTFMIYLPLNYENAAGLTIPQVILGSAAAGFAISSPDPSALTVPAGSVAGVNSVALLSNGNLMAAWQVFNQTTGAVDQIWLSTYNGYSWSTPLLAYDNFVAPFPLVAYPPGTAIASGFQSFNAITVQQLPDGSIGLIFTLAAPVGGFPDAFTAFFTSILPGATLGAVFQLTDMELRHDLFQDPMNVEFMDSSGTFNTFPGYTVLPAPHPVTGEGLFRFQVWAPPGSRIAFRLMIAEVNDNG